MARPHSSSPDRLLSRASQPVQSQALWQHAERPARPLSSMGFPIASLRSSPAPTSSAGPASRVRFSLTSASDAMGSSLHRVTPTMGACEPCPRASSALDWPPDVCTSSRGGVSLHGASHPSFARSYSRRGLSRQELQRRTKMRHSRPPDYSSLAPGHGVRRQPVTWLPETVDITGGLVGEILSEDGVHVGQHTKW